jgi:AraC-like DNA-binding protein/mannose-6-phosphate isomerase-like protein (cupin superfamily)
MNLYKNEEWLESDEFLFCATIYTFYKNEIIQPHSHEFIEMVYIASGLGTHDYRGQRYRISSGDVLIIEPNIEHSYQSDKNDSLLVYNILMQPSVLSTELETLFNVTSFIDFFYLEPFLRKYIDFQTFLKLEPHDHLDMQFRLNRILKEFESKEMGYRIAIKTLLIEMFIFLSRCYDKRINKPIAAINSEEEIIRHICEFIELHHAQPLTLVQICQLCGMSSSAFSSKFKQQVGKTFVEFRNHTRIEVAKTLLFNTDEKIISISNKVGFDDLSFFNRTFKQVVGLSPGDFRKKL